MSAPLTGAGNFKNSKLGGWLGALKANGVHEHAHSPEPVKEQFCKSDSDYKSLWSPDIAAAMGYGKRGRSGSAYQWWILLGSAGLAIASFIAWCVFVFRARESTDAALSAVRLNIEYWDALKAVLLATAVCYPILTLSAIAVSLWRAYLARQLNIHVPNVRWMKSCKAFQAASIISSVLVYAMFLLMVVSVAAHAMWAYTARAAHFGSYYALKYVDPVWSGVNNVVEASQSLVDNFVSLAQQVPGVGRRLAQVDTDSGNRVMVLSSLTEEDVAAMPQHVIDAGLAAARSLQQTSNLATGIGGLLNGLAGTLNSVPGSELSQAVGSITSNVAQLPGLSQVLPNGTSNPLFQTLSEVTQAVESQLLNRTGCPIYCVDLRDQSWIEDGCLCDLQRIRDGYPYLGSIWRNTVPATVLVFLMTVATTWLLLHAASQWARTRSEVKLLNRLPCAAQLAGQQQHPPYIARHTSDGLPVTAVYHQAPLPAV